MDDLERVGELVRRHIDGGLDETGRRELEDLLNRSHEARQVYVREMKLHAALWVDLKGVGKTEPAPASKPGSSSKIAIAHRRALRRRGTPSSPALPVALSAAACVLVILAVALTTSKPTPTTSVGKTSPPDAALETGAPKEQETPPARSEARNPKPAPPTPVKERSADPIVPVAPRPPERPVAPPPSRPEEKSAPPPAPPTVAAVAKVESAERASVQAGQDVLAGQTLTSEKGGSVVVKYEDGTRLELGAETASKFLPADAPGRGKQVLLERGVLGAQVAPQPAGRPMVFVTPHGEATVLGTTLRITVVAGKTDLEVKEGKVRLKRATDGRTVDVPAGHHAVAAVGVELAAWPTEILLLPQQGTIVGADWRAMKDPNTTGGIVIESRKVGRGVDLKLPGNPFRQIPSYVAFSFLAEADVDYHVWVRGWTTAVQERNSHDCLALEIPGAVFQPEDLVFAPYGFELDYFDEHDGYGWSGGGTHNRFPEKGRTAVHKTVRFSRAGRQTLALYVQEGPMRVSAIWLSPTQKTAPSPAQQGPGATSK